MLCHCTFHEEESFECCCRLSFPVMSPYIRHLLRLSLRNLTRPTKMITMTRMMLMLTAPCVSYKASSAAFFCLCDQSNTFWERCSILSASDDLGQIKPRKYYSPFSSELPLNFVANFPIHKISLNLFVIISKTSKIYNPFFVLLINGHFESMVAVSDSALPTYFPPFKSSSADRPTQLVFYVFFWHKLLSWSERRLTGLPDTIKMWHPLLRQENFPWRLSFLFSWVALLQCTLLLGFLRWPL